ncbi:MAG: hypothetical protein RDU89_02390 [bacterium]|nr:hypothetical protein [bacterium]
MPGLGPLGPVHYEQRARLQGLVTTSHGRTSTTRLLAALLLLHSPLILETLAGSL